MTGFARETGTSGSVQWAWEIKTVNGRGLDVKLRTPLGFEAAGEEARALVAKGFSRGNAQLNLTAVRAVAAPRLRVNEAVLGALVEALNRVRLPDGVRPASVDGLLAVRGVVEVEEAGEDEAERAALAASLRAGAERLIAALQAARAQEGQALAGIIAEQLDRIERLVEAAEAHPGRRPEAIRARLQDQIAALMDTGTAFDPARLHQEAVLIAARADIREELDRLKAHVAAARDLIAEGGAVGRRLDFLAQEFGRESNTLCAKANDVALSRIGLDLKAVVEQFREQVQNVE